MILKIINYSVKALIIVVGILLLSGALSFNDSDTALMRVFGIVLILFGLYRIVLFRTKSKKYNFSDWKENEDNENDENK